MKTHEAPHPEGYACWFDLMAHDPAQIEDFYRAVFGWTLENQGEDYGHYRMAYADGRAAAKAAGGKVGHGPFDTPFGRIAVINDPAGAVFSVLRPPPTP